MSPYSHPSRPIRIARHVALAALALSTFALVFGWGVQIAWNAVVPDVFGLPVISYWQAVAFLVLVRGLTGRFSHGSHHRHHRRFGRHGMCGKSAFPQGGDSAALYSAWWDAEGEAAFHAYAQRQVGSE